MNLFEQMQKFDTKRNPVFNAIDKLKDPKDIQQFMKEYEEWMLNSGEPSIKGREVEVARSNVGYILGYCGEETQKLWYRCLDVSHTFFGHSFGRGKEVTSQDAYDLGIESGKKIQGDQHE